MQTKKQAFTFGRRVLLAEVVTLEIAYQERSGNGAFLVAVAPLGSDLEIGQSLTLASLNLIYVLRYVRENLIFTCFV